MTSSPDLVGQCRYNFDNKSYMVFSTSYFSWNLKNWFSSFKICVCFWFNMRLLALTTNIFKVCFVNKCFFCACLAQLYICQFQWVLRQIWNLKNSPQQNVVIWNPGSNDLTVHALVCLHQLPLLLTVVSYCWLNSASNVPIITVVRGERMRKNS